MFPEGLVASDGRLQPGDQIIEINGADMTCATHAQVCQLYYYLHEPNLFNVFLEEKAAKGPALVLHIAPNSCCWL